MVTGYKMIDLQDVNLIIDAEGVEVKGIYEAIESNHRKAIMITGLTIDGVERSNRWVNFRVVNSEFVGLMGFNDNYVHLLLKISEDDKVSLINI